MIRDEELNRLIRYAQGMGISVRFKPYIPRSRVAAEWTTDGTEITIYFTSKCSKLDKILNIIHELGHHKGFVDNNRQIDPKLEEALDDEENLKKNRKRLLDMETADSLYWEDIYRDTNCQFGIERLRRQREFDIWTYEFTYETGREATKKEKAAKRKELKRKYG